jgi:hypothetical protein
MDKGATMERGVFEAEGKLQVGPSKDYFAFLDGDFLGRLLLDHFGGEEEMGYTDPRPRARHRRAHRGVALLARPPTLTSH